MLVNFIAADSLGVRSMATFVKTKDVKIFIDPSCSLAPKRYGLPPHSKEIEALKNSWKVIEEYVKISDIVIVTHYHYDHHNPLKVKMLKGKILLLKDPEKENKSQERRGKFFIKEASKYAKEIIIADSKKFKFGETKVIFSDPVFHGTNSKLGYVIEVFIKEGRSKKETFLFTSDVEGPAIDEQLRFILKNKANLIYIDGPLSYMLGYRYKQEFLDKTNENLIKICNKVKPEYIVIDHHFLRDLKWKDRIAEAYNKCKKTKILCVAEYLGKPINMLEARRSELYRLYPESKNKKFEVLSD